jgi:hypothetical protein
VRRRPPRRGRPPTAAAIPDAFVDAWPVGSLASVDVPAP